MLVPLSRIPRWMVWTMQPFARLHLGQELSDPDDGDSAFGATDAVTRASA